MSLYRLLSILIIVIVVFVVMRLRSNVQYGLADIRSAKDLIQLFPHDAEYTDRATRAYLADARQLLQEIKDVADERRTFENTFKSYDYLTALSDLTIFHSILYALTYLHPHKALRDAAQKNIQLINNFFVEVSADKQLYHALKYYAENQAQQASLTEEERYFIQETLDEFKRSGLELSDEKLAQVKALNKELADLAILFDKHIDEDQSYILVDKDGLQGVSPEFIATLPEDEQGRYRVGVDYPTMAQVLDHATSADTRKRLYLAFQNRAYPTNVDLLKTIIAKRHELATLLGFSSYADYSLSDQMVGSVDRVTQFLNRLDERATVKLEKEIKELQAQLPEAVQLSPDGTIYPWDLGYIKAQIKKTQYNIDERHIAEYFPVEKAIEGMLDIYAKFLSLRFIAEPIKGLWVDGLTLLSVYKQHDTSLLGYVILDLYPRADKFSHAACQNIIPATYLQDGKPTVAVSQLMANFPPAHNGQPALFKRSDVTTFFHEFGHALHGMLGRTTLASFAGTRVKRDFVELPSQMLEEWMTDAAILKQLSSHYQTGAQLPDEDIARIQALKHFDTGFFVQRQACLSRFALHLFDKQQPITDIDAVWKELNVPLNRYIAYVPEAHFYTAFGHLTGYGAKYYGYLWSKVFALDIFDEIKRHGLLDPVIGARYTQEVIGRGGSVDPQQLLENFLGRPPREDAFFKDMGI